VNRPRKGAATSFATEPSDRSENGLAVAVTEVTDVAASSAMLRVRSPVERVTPCRNEAGSI
jgi:hypothetical protein